MAPQPNVAAAMAATMALLAACTTTDGGVITVSVTGRGLPSPVEALVLNVLRVEELEDQPVATYPATPDEGSEIELPWNVVVPSPAPSDDGQRLYRFRAVARLAGNSQVAAQARQVFLSGTRLLLPLRLYATCVDVTCARTETCGEMGCTDDAVAPCEIPAGGGIEPRCDAGLDASRDGAIDASTPDTSIASDLGSTPPDASLDAAVRDGGRPRDAGPADECVTPSSCDECTLRATCGWCDETATCASGSASGPVGESCGTWRWLNSECAADAGADPTDAGGDPTDAADDPTDAADDPTDAGPPDYCAGFGNCSECDFEHTNTCGWCADEGLCRRGEGSGPYEGTCSSWTFFPVGC